MTPKWLNKTFEFHLQKRIVKRFSIHYEFNDLCFFQAKHSTYLNFHEEGKDYKEDIVFDEETNTTEFYVPKHGNVPFATRYLYDHNLVS